MRRIVTNIVIVLVRAKNIVISFFSEYVLFIVSTIIYQGARFVSSIIAAKILGPSTFGIWNILSLVITYGSVVHLGVINAMNREVPFYQGKGDFHKIDDIRRNTLGFVLISTLCGCFILIILSLFISDDMRKYLLLTVFLFSANQLYVYIQAYLKADVNFKFLSYLQIIFSFVLLVMSIFLTLKLGLSGFIIAQFGAIIIVYVLVLKSKIIKWSWQFNSKNIAQLIKIGFPIMMVGLLYSFLTTLDRWIILHFLGIKQLGYYTLSIMVVGIFTLAPSAISQQIYPIMARAFGQNSNLSDLIRWCIRQIVMGIGITIPLLLFMFFVFPFFVKTYLYEYYPGLLSMKITLIGMVFFPLASAFGNILNVINKQVYYMIVQFFVLLVNLLVSTFLIYRGWGINGVALGTSVSYLVYVLLLAIIVKNMLKNNVG